MKYSNILSPVEQKKISSFSFSLPFFSYCTRRFKRKKTLSPQSLSKSYSMIPFGKCGGCFGDRVVEIKNLPHLEINNNSCTTKHSSPVSKAFTMPLSTWIGQRREFFHRIGQSEKVSLRRKIGFDSMGLNRIRTSGISGSDYPTPALLHPSFTSTGVGRLKFPLEADEKMLLPNLVQCAHRLLSLPDAEDRAEHVNVSSCHQTPWRCMNSTCVAATLCRYCAACRLGLVLATAVPPPRADHSEKRLVMIPLPPVCSRRADRTRREASFLSLSPCHVVPHLGVTLHPGHAEESGYGSVRSIITAEGAQRRKIRSSREKPVLLDSAPPRLWQRERA